MPKNKNKQDLLFDWVCLEGERRKVEGIMAVVNSPEGMMAMIGGPTDAIGKEFEVIISRVEKIVKAQEVVHELMLALRSEEKATTA